MTDTGRFRLSFGLQRVGMVELKREKFKWPFFHSSMFSSNQLNDII